MEGMPVLGLSAYSGTGKTTLMEQLIAALTARGLRVGAVKHDSHDFDIDRPGKDSYRFTQAGAAVTAITSAKKTALIRQTGASLEEALTQIGVVDIALVEGWKDSGISRIGLCRKAAGKDFPGPVESYVALVTDREDVTGDVPKFGFDEIEELTEFIMENKRAFTHFDVRGRAKTVEVGGRTPPSMDAWLREAKAASGSENTGMYLTHNGVVRATARARVRQGEERPPVRGMRFGCDREKAAAAAAQAGALPGIFHVRVWLNEGELKVGDDLMYVLVGGDIRPHVISALETLVETLKAECVTEEEISE